MAVEITWNFLCRSRGIEKPFKEELCRSPDCDVQDLVEELLDRGYEVVTFTGQEWEKWAWPGGYPIYYICADSECLCSDCANKNINLTADPLAEPDWRIVDADINWEDEHLFCAHCNNFIESAYGETARDRLKEKSE